MVISERRAAFPIYRPKNTGRQHRHRKGALTHHRRRRQACSGGRGAVKSLRETDPETGAQPRANFRQIQRAYYPIGGGPAGICRNLHSAAGAYPLPGLDQTGSGNAGRRQGPRSAARLTLYRPGLRSIALRELPQLRPGAIRPAHRAQRRKRAITTDISELA